MAPVSGFTFPRWNEMSQDTEEPGPPPKPSILVIDDEPAIGMLLRRLLQRSGFDVVVAQSGDEGLRLLATGFLPQVMLVDLLMPGMNGAVFIEKARADGVVCPVFIVSASPEAAEHAARLGAAGHLRKPYEFHELVAAVRAVLEAGR